MILGMKSIHVQHVSSESLDAPKRLGRSHRRLLQGESQLIRQRATKVAPSDSGYREAPPSDGSGRRIDILD